MEVKATAKYVRISPRKVRLVVDAVRGRPVDEALATLQFLPNAAAKAVAKVVESAAANAENNYQMSPEELYVARIYADEGPTLKRFKPRSRGRTSPILKRSSHITVVVGQKEEKE
jgi:large subunit ribosomal protein L22